MGRKMNNSSLRVGYVCYRGWAFALLDQVRSQIKGTTITFPLLATVPYTAEKIDYTRYPGMRTFNPQDKAALPTLVRESAPDVLLFYGWSWLVPDELTTTIDCLCLHPSLLPKYRGGCPLQHQILNDEQEGGLTIFRMNAVLDGGDILAQRKFSLAGTLGDIFQRLIDQGARATVDILQRYQKKSAVARPQHDLEKFPVWRRRTPPESELKFDQLATMPARHFYNFVRALDDPYPNAYIRLTDDTQVYIREVRLLKTPPASGSLLNGTVASVNDRTYIALKDGYAQLVRYGKKP